MKVKVGEAYRVWCLYYPYQVTGIKGGVITLEEMGGAYGIRYERARKFFQGLKEGYWTLVKGGA